MRPSLNLNEIIIVIYEPHWIFLPIKETNEIWFDFLFLIKTNEWTNKKTKNNTERKKKSEDK